MKKQVDLSPNFSKKSRRANEIRFIIIHYTGMQSEIESINKLKNINSRVSCHYLINRVGNIIQMVKDNKVAWHSGKSKWKEFSNLNQNSIGIELVNKGHEFGYESFTNLQINSLIKLCRKLKRKYKIKRENLLGHSDIAPLRKIDPGEKFPWKKLSKFGLGKWYKKNSVNYTLVKNKNMRALFFRNLYKIGYRYFNVSKIGKRDQLVIKAFKQHFLPHKVNGKIDQKALEISHFLAN